jgi:hypothetical protein
MTSGRKILYFLGAGASYGAGAATRVQGGGLVPIPTQSTFWETLLRFGESPRRHKVIESLLFRYFRGYAKVPSRLRPVKRRQLLRGIDVEEVFTFLSERSRAPSTSAALRSYTAEAWEALVQEVGVVFSRFRANASTRAAYRRLLSRHIRSWDAMVSFNWDTVFEDSLPPNRRWAYEGLEDTTDCLRVMKPHGSVNWEWTAGGIRTKRLPALSVIVAPTHLKFVPTSEKKADRSGAIGYLDQAQEIQDIWTEMERQMRQAKALIFIGYSFPVSDLYFSSVLRSVLASRSTSPVLVVVNPDAVAIVDRLQGRFAVPSVARYFDLAQFLQADREGVLAQVS